MVDNMDTMGSVDNVGSVDSVDSQIAVSTDASRDNGKHIKGITPFWRNRLIEAGMILSMALYYIIGNQHFGTIPIFRVNPLVSLPFLLLFATLCWYRLPVAVALLPLTLPYYSSDLQKTVISHYAFSLAEITLAVCLIV